MSRINTNVPALRAIARLGINHDDLNLRLQRLSSGLRINRGADDPAGLIASETLRSEMAATEQAISNSARANNVIATAEGALHEVSALLLELQQLIVSTSNEAGLSQEEVRANQLQIDSILSSIDRIGETTTFGHRKLLNGSMAYQLSGVPTAALASVAVHSARLNAGGAPRSVDVRVTQSAQTAQLAFVGTNPGGVSTTSAVTIQVRGTLGSELLSFASGTTLAGIRDAINNAHTGVSAAVANIGPASSLVLHSIDVGSGAFVSVFPITGNFVESANAGVTLRASGIDAQVLVDGQPAAVDGLRASVRGNGIDATMYLTRSFAQSLTSASFDVIGGGAVFQLTSQVNPNGQLFAGFAQIDGTSLGNAAVGLLYSLRSGAGNDLESRNFPAAQAIVNEAINQVASYRGRLGTLQRNHLEPNINSQRVALENITASESVIRDADIAVETSALTRAEILVQSTQAALQIANSLPRQVLALLQ